MEEIKHWAVNIAAVAVLMILLDLVMPEGRIRKFTQLLSGFVLMFVMINPVLGLFGKGVPASFAGWSDESFLWNSQVKTITGNLRDESSRQTLDLYRSLLVSDIRNRLESHEQIERAEVEVVIYENQESQEYGQIRKLYVNLMLQDNRDGSEPEREGIYAQIHRELQQVFLLKEEDIILQITEGE